MCNVPEALVLSSPLILVYVTDMSLLAPSFLL